MRGRKKYRGGAGRKFPSTQNGSQQIPGTKTGSRNRLPEQKLDHGTASQELKAVIGRSFRNPNSFFEFPKPKPVPIVSGSGNWFCEFGSRNQFWFREIFLLLISSSFSSLFSLSPSSSVFPPLNFHLPPLIPPCKNG